MSRTFDLLEEYKDLLDKDIELIPSNDTDLLRMEEIMEELKKLEENEK